MGASMRPLAHPWPSRMPRASQAPPYALPIGLTPRPER